VKGFAAFESKAICGVPPSFGFALLKKSDEFKKKGCGDGSGNYDPTCRDWYIN
jgi:hypothetical protein